MATSLTEIGYSDTDNGLWNTSSNQRLNYNESTSTVGTNNSESAVAYSCLRSTVNLQDVYTIYPNNTGAAERYVDPAAAVRPALHFNLKSAAKSVDDS